MTEAPAHKNWRFERDLDGIAWLTLDRAQASVNALSREVLEELAQILKGLPREGLNGVALRSGKPTGFIVGANIKEFTELKNEEEALGLIRLGQSIFDTLEALPVPTAVLIHGPCLGGGLELSLACTYRLASDAPETRLGLPEVKLGIHPGFGGTMRSIRLLGAPAALDLMLTGRSVPAKAARRMGLVDQVMPERHLAAAARALLLKAPAPARPSWVLRLLSTALLRPLVARSVGKQVAARANPAHYPAPFALLDLWKRHGGDPQTMLEAEARSVAALITAPPSRNLVRLFLLQEQLKALGKGASFQPRFVHVVGGGAMGGDIAAWCALQGLTVTVQDVDAARLAKVVKRAAGLFKKVLKEPRLVQAALDRLIPDLRGDGVTRADVVIEAIFENLEAKRELFRQLEPRLKPGALLATNTSSIPLEELAVALKAPERLVGLHFFNPVAKMQLVEVVEAPATDPEAARQGLAFVRAIKRLPLPVKSSPGFLVNRILMPYLMEAVTLVEEGFAPAAIDKAALDFGMPMGPVLLADTVGLDICLSVAKIFQAHFGAKVPRVLEDLVAKGHLGLKSGRGFYTFKGDKPIVPSAPSEIPPDLQSRIILRLLNEAAACLREGVVADPDLLDAGVVYGTGFAPFRGGPIQHARSEGFAAIAQRLQEHEARLGPRFKPDAKWGELG